LWSGDRLGSGLQEKKKRLEEKRQPEPKRVWRLMMASLAKHLLFLSCRLHLQNAYYCFWEEEAVRLVASEVVLLHASKMRARSFLTLASACGGARASAR
jgi:hypothetical protein